MNILKVYLPLLLCIVLIDRAVAQKYYPLTLSNKWCYHRTNAWYPGDPTPPVINDSATIKIVADTFVVNGNRYYTLSNTDIADGKYVRVDTAAIYYWDSGMARDFPIFNLKGSIGDTTLISYGLIQLIRIDTLNIFGNPSIVRTYEIYKGTSYWGQVRYSDIYGPLTQWFYGSDPPGPWPTYTMELIGCNVSGNTYGTVVSVNKMSSLPFGYTVSHNYPNPFNPETTVNYSLPGVADVNITISNLLGQHICHSDIRNQVAGSHSIRWNGSNYSSGVYILTIHTKYGVLSERITLLK